MVCDPLDVNLRWAAYWSKPRILNEEDLKIALNSLEKFTEFDVENVITYHGGLFTNNPNERIKELRMRAD